MQAKNDQQEQHFNAEKQKNKPTMSANTVTFTINLDGNAYTGVAQIDAALGKMQTSVGNTKSAFESFRNSAFNFDVITNAIGKVSRAFQSMVGSSLDFEQQQANMRTLMNGDAEATDNLIGKIREYGKATVYDRGGLIEAQKTMMSFGLDAEYAFGKLKNIGDIALGDKQKMNSLALAFSQMSSSGKLMGQDLMQMINAGFNPLEVISQKTGKSMAVLKDEMSKGAISAEMVAQAFEWATEEGGRFYQGAETAAQTTAGKIAKTEDQIDDFKISLFEATGGLTAWISELGGMAETASTIYAVAEGAFMGISNGITWVRAHWAGFVAQVKAGVAKIAANMQALKLSIISAGGFFPWLKVMAVNACRAISIAIKSIPIVGWIAAAVSAIIALFALLWKKCEGFRRLMTGLWEFVKSIVNGVWQLVKAVVLPIWDGLLKPIFSMLKEDISKLLNSVKSVFASLKMAITEVWERIKPVLSAVAEKIRNVGGVIMKVIGVVVRIITKVNEIVTTVVMKIMGVVIKVAGSILAVVGRLVKTVWEGFLKPVFTRLMDFASQIWNRLKSVFDRIRSAVFKVWERIKPVLSVVAEKIRNVGGVIMKVIGVVVRIVTKVHEIVTTVVMKVVGVVIKVAGSILTVVGRLVKTVWEGFLKPVFTRLMDFASRIWNRLKPVFDRIWNAVSKVWERLKSVFDRIRNAVSKVWEYLKPVFDRIWNAVLKVWERLKSVFDRIRSAVSKVWERLKPVLSAVAEKLKSVIRVLGKIQEFSIKVIGFIVAAIGIFVKNVWEKFLKPFLQRLKDIVLRVIETVRNVVSKIVGILLSIKDKIVSMVTSVRNFFAELWSKIAEGIRSLYEQISGFVSGVWNWISDKLGNITGWIKTKMVDPIKNAFKGLWRVVRDVFDKILTKLGKLFAPIRELWNKLFPKDKMKDVKLAYTEEKKEEGQQGAEKAVATNKTAEVLDDKNGKNGKDGTNGINGINGITNKELSDGALGKNAGTVAGKAQQITIRLENMVGTMNFNGGLRDNASNVESTLAEMMARILGMAETAA